MGFYHFFEMNSLVDPFLPIASRSKSGKVSHSMCSFFNNSQSLASSSDRPDSSNPTSGGTPLCNILDTAALVLILKDKDWFTFD